MTRREAPGNDPLALTYHGVGDAVIRRERLCGVGWAEGLCRDIGRGEAVRIIGLGTLERVKVAPTWRAYRLTLTAAVVKNEVARDGGVSAMSTMVSDVRHLARALGAPVEVWVASVSYGGREQVAPARRALTVAP